MRRRNQNETEPTVPNGRYHAPPRDPLDLRFIRDDVKRIQNVLIVCAVICLISVLANVLTGLYILHLVTPYE